MRHARVLITAGLVLALTGCISSTTLITVRADGSGTIEQTTTMSTQAVAQLAAMAGAFGGKNAKEPAKVPDFFTEAEARSAAAKMGPGVRFVSGTPIKTADLQGITAVYAFDDVTRVTIDQKPGAAAGLGGDMAMGGARKEQVVFKFARQPGGTSLVTVVFPEMTFDKGDKENEEEEAEGKQDEAQQAQAMEMAKQMFKGMRIAIALKVDGRIIRTNSQYVDGSTVTLLDMDMDTLIADPALLKKIGRPRSLDEAKHLLKGVPGFKVNLEPELTVQFAGR